jgi:hypothetical protein
MDNFQIFTEGKIWLEFCCLEHIKLSEKAYHKNAINQEPQPPVVHESKTQLYHQKILVRDIEASDVLDQAGVPFKLQLPDFLPSLFSYKFTVDEEDCFAKVLHHLTCTFEPKKADEPKLLSSSELVVNPAVTYEVPYEVNLIKKVFGCYFLNRGFLKIHGWMDKLRYNPGDNAIICVEVDASKCKLGISSIEVSLIQEVQFKCCGFSYGFTKCLNSLSFPGFAAETSHLGSTALRLPVMLCDMTTNGHLPLGIPTSCSSKNISNDYKLVVTMKTDSLHMQSDDAVLELPLLLVNKSTAALTNALQETTGLLKGLKLVRKGSEVKAFDQVSPLKMFKEESREDDITESLIPHCRH